MGLRKSGQIEPLREIIERERPRDLHGLGAQLREAEVDVRRWAARDLAAFPGAEPLLGNALLTESDASVREALFTSLAALSGEPAVDALLPLLRSDDAHLRNGAIEALAGMPRAVGPRVTRLLLDADVDVRIFTVNLLGVLRHADVTGWLLHVLEHDGDVNVVAAAIEVLAETGSADHIPLLRAARRRFAADEFIGFASDMAIQRIEST